MNAPVVEAVDIVLARAEEDSKLTGEPLTHWTGSQNCHNCASGPPTSDMHGALATKHYMV